MWDAATGKILAEHRGHTEGIRVASWSPDGTKIVTAAGTADAIVRVYVAMFGAPDIPEDETGTFIMNYVPSPVKEFLEGILGEEGVELANRANFANAFVAGQPSIAP